MSWPAFLAAVLALPLLGAGAAFHPSVRSENGRWRASRRRSRWGPSP